MAFRTWQYALPAGAGTLRFKGEKKKADNFAREITWRLYKIESHQRELSGIIEPNGTVTEARESTYITIGAYNPVRAPETLEAERAALLSEMPEVFDLTTDEGMKAVEEFWQKVKELFSRHVALRDQRRTREEEDKRNAEYKAHREREEAETARRRAREIEIAPGRTVVLLSLCVDNSDPMSDYFAPHVTVDSWAILSTSAQSETQALARLAVEGIEELARVEFEWRTEKYSMGHGNYLMQNGGPRPTVTERSGKTREGHWEVTFSKTYASAGRFIPHAKYRDAFTATANALESTEGSYIATVQRNEAHHGIEVKFVAKPAGDVIASLKAHGFRWSQRQGLWYTHFTDDKYAWALQVFSPERLREAQVA